MRLYRCDRCGKYVSKRARDFFVRRPTRGVYRLSKKIHLCTECAESFRRWLHGTEKAADVLPKGDEK